VGWGSGRIGWAGGGRRVQPEHLHQSVRTATVARNLKSTGLGQNCQDGLTMWT
jgi:hypothetical protein